MRANISAKNIFIYVYLLSPIFIYLGVNENILYVFLLFFSSLLIIDGLTLGITERFFEVIRLIFPLLLVDKVNDFFVGYNYIYIGHFIFLMALILTLFFSIDDWNGLFEKFFYSSLISSFVLIVLNLRGVIFEGSKVGSGLGLYLVVIFFYSFRFSLTKRLIFFGFSLGLIFYLGLRSSQISVFFIILASFLGKRFLSEKILINFLFIGGLLLVFMGIYYEVVIVGGVSNLLTGRGLIWASLLNEIDSNYIFGVGNERIIDFSEEIDRSVYNAIILGNPHSGLVYYMYNTGIIGIILFYLLLKKLLHKSSLDRLILFGAIFVIYLFEGVGIHSLNYISVIILLLLFAKSDGRSGKSNPFVHRSAPLG